MQPPSSYLAMRMRQRQISEAEIDQVLAHPQTTYPSADVPDRTVVLGQTEGHPRLKVVIVTGSDFVVTVADRDSEE